MAVITPLRSTCSNNCINLLKNDQDPKCLAVHSRKITLNFTFSVQDNRDLSGQVWVLKNECYFFIKIIQNATPPNNKKINKI